MKTYSVAFKNKKGIWITNWNEHTSLDDINWNEVEQFSKEREHLAYGYYYGHHSSGLTSARCRTVLKELQL